MDPKQTVCVVVPVYNNELAKHELAALDRCVSILGNHPIALVTPQGFDTQELLQRHPTLINETFQSDFFDGIMGYNRMMLSDELYARFVQYEFILIHQLDAFVFSDQLLDWCSRGHDYVGAPWIPDAQLPNFWNRMRLAAIRKAYRITNKHIDHATPGNMNWKQYLYASGNGGFSLRRVSKMRKTLTALHERAELYRSGKIHSWAEDIFFSVEPNRFFNRLRIPNLKEAAHFAWELNPAAAAKLTDGKLPFGCHAWDKYSRDDWRPIFARLGYSLDELLGISI